MRSPGLRVDRGDDARDDARVVQEMLAEALAGADHPSCLREFDRREQAAGIGAPGRGQVERRAVVHRGARKWQAQRDIDRMAEARVLDHRQSLVVIHREHGIGLVRARRA